MKKEIFILAGLLIGGTILYGISQSGRIVEDAIEEGSEANKIEGYLVMGHEVRTFRPCGEGVSEYWVVGKSSAYSNLHDTYNRETADVLPSAYAPLFVSVRGEIVSGPFDGFGSDFTEGIIIESLLGYEREGSCKSDLIKVTSPHTGEAITTPLKIEGEARGYWFFEASFPVILTDWDGKIVAEGFVTAEEEWMTEEFVPFTGELEFIKPDFDSRGTLILKKHNASDIAELDDALEIPVTF